MENYQISPVIRSGIKIIENTIEGVTVNILDDEMSRSQPTEFLPLGALGVNTEIVWDQIGINNVFLTCQLCEDMHTPYGDLVAEEFIFSLFEKDIR